MRKKYFALTVVALVFSLLISSGIVMGSDLPEITIWAKSGPEGEALKDSAFVYERQTGNKVNVVVMGRSGYRSKYRTALMAGSTEVEGILDVAYVVPSLAAGGFLEPLNDYIAGEEGYTDGLLKSVQREMKYDGTWYMVPTDLSAESLVYRTDLISEPPATWEELLENAKKFTKDLNPESPTSYGYAFAGAPGVLHGTWRGLRYAWGGRIIDDEGNVLLDQPETIESFQFFVDFKDKHQVTPPDVTAWDYPELLTALQEGVVAQASFFTAGMPILTDAEQTPELYDKLAFVPQPAGPAGAFTRLNPLGIIVNASSTKKEATWEFLSWLTGPKGGRVYTKFGGTSPRESIILDEEFTAKRPWYPALYEAAKNGVGSIRHGRASEITDTFNNWAGLAITGQMSVEEAFKNAAEEIRDIIE